MGEDVLELVNIYSVCILGLLTWALAAMRAQDGWILVRGSLYPSDGSFLGYFLGSSVCSVGALFS